MHAGELGATTDDEPIDATIAQDKPRVNGKVEVHFLFVTPTKMKHPNIHRSGRVVMRAKRLKSLLAPESEPRTSSLRRSGSSMNSAVEYEWIETIHELGPLQRLPPVMSAVRCEMVPETIRLEVSVVPAPVQHPAEELLASHCLDLLRNDAHKGSVASSHLQNQVRELPFYSHVIAVTRTNWTEFVSNHPDKWDCFKYSAEEISALDLHHTCRPKETRLFAHENALRYREGDVARERIRVHCNKELHDLIVTRLNERPWEQSELLSELINEPCFLAMITPNLTKVLDLYEADSNYFVVCSPYHPIAVEPRVEPHPEDVRRFGLPACLSVSAASARGAAGACSFTTSQHPSVRLTPEANA